MPNAPIIIPNIILITWSVFPTFFFMAKDILLTRTTKPLKCLGFFGFNGWARVMGRDNEQ